MKNQLLTLSLFAFILMFSACGNKAKSQGSEQITERIADLEKKMVDTSQIENRRDIMRELAAAYQEYAIENPKADDATDRLLKAAQNYGTIGEFDKATTIFKSIIEVDSKTGNAKDAMFQMAYIYEAMAKFDMTKSEEYNINAKKYYEMLITEFPNDPLATQSKMLMDNIGKSDKELLDAVIKKSQE